MSALGAYEQRNAGTSSSASFAGGVSDRATAYSAGSAGRSRSASRRTFAGPSVEAPSQLLVTTIGAVSGGTMRGYIGTADGRALRPRLRDEAPPSPSRAAPGRKDDVDPMPPGWNGRSVPGPAQDAWLPRSSPATATSSPRCCRNFERGRRPRSTSSRLRRGPRRKARRRDPVNAAIVETVHAIFARRARARPRAPPRDPHFGGRLTVAGSAGASLSVGASSTVPSAPLALAYSVELPVQRLPVEPEPRRGARLVSASAARTRSMYSRSRSRASCRARARRRGDRSSAAPSPAPAGHRPRCLGSQSAIARSTTFSSSRTFPGHG